MKIIIAGGTGFLGSNLANYYAAKGHEVVILTRGENQVNGTIRFMTWDGETLGAWASELDNADILINLNGKSVDCRYTERNKQLIYSTRLEATRVLGEAVKSCVGPPALWINAASATIYRHSLDKEMDEFTSETGTGFSVDVCQKWEKSFNEIELPFTRKVILRTSIVLGKDGPFKPLKMLTKLGLGGGQGSGQQYFSWLHEKDFVGIVDYIISNPSMKGAYNVTAPKPIPNTEFMKALRHAVGIPFGLPMPKWLLEFGAVLIGTETELILKSRRVVPKRLLDAGYQFQFNSIEKAFEQLLHN